MDRVKAEASRQLELQAEAVKRGDVLIPMGVAQTIVWALDGRLIGKEDTPATLPETVKG